MLPKTIDRETRKEYWRVRCENKRRGGEYFEYCARGQLNRLETAMAGYEHANNEFESELAMSQYWSQLRRVHLLGAVIARNFSLTEDFITFLEAASHCTRNKQMYDEKNIYKDPDA